MEVFSVVSVGGLLSKIADRNGGMSDNAPVCLRARVLSFANSAQAEEPWTRRVYHPVTSLKTRKPEVLLDIP